MDTQDRQALVQNWQFDDRGYMEERYKVAAVTFIRTSLTLPKCMYCTLLANLCQKAQLSCCVSLIKKMLYLSRWASINDVPIRAEERRIAVDS